MDPLSDHCNKLELTQACYAYFSKVGVRTASQSLLATLRPSSLCVHSSRGPRAMGRHATARFRWPMVNPHRASHLFATLGALCMGFLPALSKSRFFYHQALADPRRELGNARHGLDFNIFFGRIRRRGRRLAVCEDPRSHCCCNFCCSSAQ